MTLLSFTAYAKHRGVSQPYISQMVKRGKIPLVDGKIDPVAADAALDAHADVDMAPVAAYHAARRSSAKSPEAPAPSFDPADDPPIGEGRYVETALSRAKTKDAEYQAKQRQIDYERSVGKLVEMIEVARAIGAIAPALNQLDTIPDRIIARLRAAPDDHTARLMLAEEIAAGRQAIADFCTVLLERIGVVPS